MTRIFLTILFLISAITGNLYSQVQDPDRRLEDILSHYGQATVRIPYPGRNVLAEIDRKIPVISVHGKYAELSLSPADTAWFLSQSFSYEIVEYPLTKGTMTASGISDAMLWDSYPKYSDYVQIMKNFTLLYPDLCKLDTIGFSNYGKLVLALRITSGTKPPADKPETFYSSTIHGNETGGFILMMRLADYLLKNYSTDSRIKNLVDNLRIWINPLANPDGTYGKTDSLLPVPTRRNAHGVDLNRDFPDPGKALDSVRQKETLDMMKFMKKHHFVISANFHSGDELVNYPWDRWSRLHADNNWFETISREYADTVHSFAPAGYMDEFENGITNGYDWYQVLGGRQDYMTYSLHGREVTIELDYNYVAPVSTLESLWNYNRESLIGYIENAIYGIHGHVTDKQTGKPVGAMIYIENHDRDSSQVFSDTLTGSYTRLIAPGLWTISYSAKGYYSKSIENVEVVQDTPLDLDVELDPIINAVDTIATPVVKIYPDPASSYIRIVFPDRQIGRVNVRIFDSLGRKIADYDDNALEDTAMVFNVRKLSGGTYSVIITNRTTGVSDRGRFIVIRGD